MNHFFEQFKADIVFMGDDCDHRSYHRETVVALRNSGSQFISITLGGYYMNSIFPLLAEENNRVRELNLGELTYSDRCILQRNLRSSHCKVQRLTINGIVIPPYDAESVIYKGVAQKWKPTDSVTTLRFRKVSPQLYATLLIPTNSVTHLTLGGLSARDATELCTSLKGSKVEYLHVLNDVPFNTLTQVVDTILSELTKIKTLVLFLRFFDKVVTGELLQLISEGRTTLRNLKICGLYFVRGSLDAIWVATQSKHCTLLNFDISQWDTEMRLDFTKTQAKRHLLLAMLSAKVPRLRAPIGRLPRDMFLELNNFL